jgi:hypothetical protein
LQQSDVISVYVHAEKTSFNTVDNISPVEKSSSTPLAFIPFMIVFSVLDLCDTEFAKQFPEWR